MAPAAKLYTSGTAAHGAPVKPAQLPSLAELETVVREAGALVMEVYRSDFAVRSKGDTSPVTAADERAEQCISLALQHLAPEIPLVAEEAASRGDVPQVQQRFWLVDPLDGTREFVARNGEFTVNVALVENGAPVLGLVYAPVNDELYIGQVGQGAWLVSAGSRQWMQSRPLRPRAAVLACSRSHGDEAALAGWLSQAQPALTISERRAIGSSLKFGLLAAGRADVYPRFGPTMEWDTAAGHAVLRAAGGEVLTLDGLPLKYGKPGFRNPYFVAWGDCPHTPGNI